VDFGETCATCAADCGQCCGDGECQEDFGENCVVCAEDCGGCCGNDVCEAFESCTTCAEDCGECQDECGNFFCANSENCTTCPNDCGECPPECGDGDCNGVENCTTCEEDCGECPVLEWCTFHGFSGDEIECPINLAASESDEKKAAGAEFVLNFNPLLVEFVHFHDELCIGNVCTDWNIPPNSSLQPTLHTLQSESQGQGKVKAVMFHAGAPDTLLSQAYMENGQVQEDPLLFSMVFKLKKDISPDQPQKVWLNGLKATDVNAFSLEMLHENGILITYADGLPAVCGDGMCQTDAGETCENCVGDCGVCPFCGDGECNGVETCLSCEEDCGGCLTQGWCPMWGQAGEEVGCSLVLAASAQADPRATGLQFKMIFNSSVATFVSFRDFLCVGDICLPLDVPPNALSPTNHTVSQVEQLPGLHQVAIFKVGQPIPITDAYMSGGQLQGEGTVMDLVFTLAEDVEEGSPEYVTLTGMKAVDASANPMKVLMEEGTLVTSP
jgi:hypothetical protein